MADRSWGATSFETGSADYARFRPSYPSALAEHLAAATPSRSHALDVGCGTGQLTTLLAAQFDHVTGIDPSASQIENAATLPNIQYRVGSAEDLDLPDRSVDLITVAQAAHWFDLPAFYREAARVARPGGLVALISYGVTEADGPLAARLKAFYWDEVHGHWPPERRHVETGYTAFSFPFPEHDVPPLSIERVWSVEDLLGYVETWSAVKGARKKGDGALVDRFAADARALCPGDAPSIRVRWPISIRLGTARPA